MLKHSKNLIFALVIGIALSALGYLIAKDLRYFIAEPKQGLGLIAPIVKTFSAGFLVTFAILELIRSMRKK